MWERKPGSESTTPQRGIAGSSGFGSMKTSRLSPSGKSARSMPKVGRRGNHASKKCMGKFEEIPPSENRFGRSASTADSW
jgi:hypothetical protein